MPACGPRLNGAAQSHATGFCSLDTDFSFFMISKVPSAAQIVAICSNSDCLEAMEAIRTAVPDECTIPQYNFQLYADILNPIQAGCAKIPATTAPAVTTSTPVTSSPSTTSFRPSTSTWTPTPTPRSTSSYTSTYDSTSSDDSGMDTFTVIAIIVACVMAFVIISAITHCCRQRRKRDPTVQVNQHLSYGNVGAFDTLATPAYTEMKTSDVPRRSVVVIKSGDAAYKPVEPSAPAPTSTGFMSSANATAAVAPDLIPLLEDEIITAARIPINKITRGSRIGGGGYGEVFLGKYKDEVVAIKTLLPQHRNDVRRIKSFLKEVKLMASLEHERIVTFVGVAWGDSVSDICVLTEYMEGGDLQSVLARFDAQHQPIGFDRTKVKIALHMAHALTYMHSLQTVVLHRDLKSSNVLLDKNMDAKIADFGISRERAESTMTRGVGTSLWMAPEVMMGGRYDEKADMFSFGVVLSELDTNKLPYATQVDLDSTKTNYVELMQSVARGRLTVEFSYESHPDIVALGRDCVAVDPAERPSAAEALHRVHQVWRQHN